ncbi:glycosyl transferase family 1 [Frankia sp. CcI49]|uniref:glycosyltransferase n=1 Tax=unclassified Frankia TaxID=2632575 RepID=UPI0006CA255C|nr:MULTISPECIES: glycosyltransferase [unclassified Frankia]KPM57511.1 glycosyl transferase family 1 [Frankia sp. R43]ONH57980.1 glycosyl transferase family 1 [Frankia sp. CcI49]
MSDSERWIVVVEEPFLPADAGGRVETFSFLTAASAAGIRMQVLVPSRTDLDIAAYEEAVPGAAVIRLPRDDSPLAHLSPRPFIHASRPVGPLRKALQQTPPRADFVISYSCRTSHLGEEIARIWRLPHLVRAHNIDSEFFHVLARSSSGPRAVAYELEYHRLRLAEQEMHHSPLINAIADISVEDHEWRRPRASVPTYHLPPFLPASTVAGVRAAGGLAGIERAGTTAVFVGSLDTPTNIEALRWFLGGCWPTIRQRHPEAILQVVGRRPEEGLAQWLGGFDGVELHTDVPSVLGYVAGATVSVNPMQSGSGVNIKAIEAMSVGTPVVSTPTGSRGLGWRAGEHLLVADDPAAFADAVCGLLENPWLAAEVGTAGRDFVLRELDHATLIGRLRSMLADQHHAASATAPGQPAATPR